MRILIVEDDNGISSFLKMSLEAEYYEVDISNNGEEGSFIARTNDYDLVILDNALPHKTGIYVCTEIRKSGKTMPILALSVGSEIDQKASFLDSGADDYMTKPFELKELLARIRALLRRSHTIKSNVYTIDNLSLDPKRYIVMRGTQRIYLTRKEFMLLEYFMQNPKIVLNRGMIMEHVWDMNADAFSNTIESHVLKLRRKIDILGMIKLIHTVPGRGYKIDIDKY